MQASSSNADDRCFMQHQVVKPAAALLLALLLLLVGWLLVTHVGQSAERLPRGRPFLGIRVVAPDELVARMFSLPPGESLIVDHVADRSPAARAGLLRGDGIVAVQGRSVTSPDDVAASLTGAKAGDLLRLTVVRGGLAHNLLVPLDAQPEATGAP